MLDTGAVSEVPLTAGSDGKGAATSASSRTTEDVKRAIGVRSSPPWIRRVVLIGTSVAVLAAAGIAFRAWRVAIHSRVPAYELVALRTGDVQVTVRATGTLQAITTVDVGAEVTGRLLSVNVDVNDPVKKGQVLALIDPSQLQADAKQTRAQVASAQASIATAKATLTEATVAAARAAALNGQGLISNNDYDAAVATKSRADAALTSAFAGAALAGGALESAVSKLNKTTIVSPIDGSVLSRLVEPGQTVTAGFTTPVLFRVAQDLTHLRLNVDVDEADIGRVREGMPATFTVEAYPDRTFLSHVVTLYNESKTSQNVVTYQGVLAVDNSTLLLRPGMTCTATILTEKKSDVLLVPNAALRFSPTPRAARPPKKVGVEGEKKRQRIYVLRGKVTVEVAVQAGATDGIVTAVAPLDPAAADLAAGAQVIVDTKDPL